MHACLLTLFTRAADTGDTETDRQTGSLVLKTMQCQGSVISADTCVSAGAFERSQATRKLFWCSASPFSRSRRLRLNSRFFPLPPIHSSPWGSVKSSQGVLVFEMMAGVAPFFANDPMTTYENILSRKVEAPPSFSKVRIERLELRLQHGKISSPVVDP